MANSRDQGIIISLGSVNADFQVRVKEKPGGKTTMLAHDFVRLSGGKAANVAYIARRLQISASLIAHVGQDQLREQALQPLREIGINLDAVQEVEGASTAVSMIFVPPDGKKHIILAPNANDEWEEKNRQDVRQVIENAPEGSVLVVDYEIPPFIVAQAVETAHKRGFPIIVDPAPADRVDESLYTKISFLVPDASETETLTGIRPDTVKDAIRAANELISRGLSTAMVKLEDGGCVVASRNILLHIPPVSVEVVDTTGAGDAFAGALATAVLEKQSLQQAACFATAASIAAVTAYGSQPAYPSREQLEALYERVSANCKLIDEQ